MFQKDFYWALIRKDNKTYLIGPEKNEVSIRQAVSKHSPITSSKLLILPTRDSTRATQIIKQKQGDLNPINHA